MTLGEVESANVHRRIGGLENDDEGAQNNDAVHRRIGGLEKLSGIQHITKHSSPPHRRLRKRRTGTCICGVGSPPHRRLRKFDAG